MSHCQLARLRDEHKIYISDVIRDIDFSRNTTILVYEKTAQKLNLMLMRLISFA